MISIIIPVYNTEKYIGKCLNSILNQTYRDYELIAVNDGSTDGSLNILQEYAKKDSRIRIIDKENEGQGVARNIAIKQAKGEYIYCIDSDDWIPEGSLLEMINKAEATCADIVVGNLATTFIDSEEIRVVNNEKVSGILEGKELKKNIFIISPSACPKLIKRCLYIDNNIVYPPIYFEDLATMPLLYAMSKRIAFVNKCVYIQRMNSSSTVHRIDNIYDRINFVEYLINGFIDRGIYEQFKPLMDVYLLKRAQINQRIVKSLTNKIYLDFVNEQKYVWKEKYGLNTKVNRQSFCYGSYNLMIITKIFMKLEDAAIVEDYFGGSSLISCMNRNNEKINMVPITHCNPFRKKMLVQDFGRSLYSMNPGTFYGNEFFFVDFLEERYDIGVYKGEYFTINQSFEDVKEKIAFNYDVIEAFSNEWWDLWKEACNRFVEKLMLMVAGKTIVLVKMYLSEKYYCDEGKMEFDEIKSIRDINEQLRICYEYFESVCPSAKVIDVSSIDEYFTDYNFRHGCYPWHLSDYAYGKIVEKIEAELNSILQN